MRKKFPSETTHQAPNGDNARHDSISQPGGPQKPVDKRDPDHEGSSSAQGRIL